MSAVVTHLIVLFISTFGITGNLVVVLVIVHQSICKRGSKVRYYYLLLGLSVSDILLLTLSILRTLIALGWVAAINLGMSPTEEIIFVWDWLGRFLGFAFIHPTVVYHNCSLS